MPTYTYTLFDDRLGVGRFGGATHARGINSAGQIVGYIDGANGSSQGFILSNGIYSPLDDPLGTQGTFPSGINSPDRRNLPGCRRRVPRVPRLPL